MSSQPDSIIERIRNHLAEARDLGGNVPHDLQSHLAEVFRKVLNYGSNDAYDKFEEISALVKQTNLKFKDPQNDWELNAQMADGTVSE